MNRPKIDKEMKLEAAKEIAKRIGDVNAETIAEHYHNYMDGYELAKELETYAGWDISMSDVEELDCMNVAVDEKLHEAEKKWFKENDIQPPLEIGTKIDQGIIEGICEHSAAKYLVKENGCTVDKRWLLIKFEDAIAA